MKAIKGFLKNFTAFDYSVLLIVLVVFLSAFFFFYRKSELVEIRVRVTDENVLYAGTNPLNWYADRFKVGEVERDTLGRELARVVNINTLNFDNNSKVVYLDLKVAAIYDSRTKLYSSRGKTLVFGTPLTFNLSGITFQGIVTDFPNSQFQENLVVKDRKIKVLVRGVDEMIMGVDEMIKQKVFTEPQVIEAIRKGDRITDSNGNVFVEVLNITTKPAQRITINDKGNLLLRFDPYYKDAIITLKVRTKVVNDQSYILDYLPLRLGVKLPLAFDDTFVMPEIYEID